MNCAWIEQHDASGETPLTRASKTGCMAVADLLLRQDTHDREMGDPGACTLHSAAYWNRAEDIQTLLADGADPDEHNDLGETPLHKAIRQGHSKATEALLEGGARPDQADALGMTPLHWVALNGRVDLAALLIEHGADFNKREALIGDMTPLALARLMFYNNLVELLTAHGALE